MLFRCPSKPWQWPSDHNTWTLKPKQLNLAIIYAIIHTCVFPTVSCPNVSHWKRPISAVNTESGGIRNFCIWGKEFAGRSELCPFFSPGWTLQKAGEAVRFGKQKVCKNTQNKEVFAISRMSELKCQKIYSSRINSGFYNLDPILPCSYVKETPGKTCFETGPVFTAGEV